MGNFIVTTATTGITAENILLLSAVVAAIIGLFGTIFSIYRWYLHQQEQDIIIKELKEEQEAKVLLLRQDCTIEMSSIKKEQQLLVYGMLACLEGLKQLNCNGSVSLAQEKFSKHLNEQAHK